MLVLAFRVWWLSMTNKWVCFCVIHSGRAWQKSHNGSGRHNLPPPQSRLRGDFSENCVKSVGHLSDINYEEEQRGGLLGRRCLPCEMRPDSWVGIWYCPAQRTKTGPPVCLYNYRAIYRFPLQDSAKFIHGHTWERLMLGLFAHRPTPTMCCGP